MIKGIKRTKIQTVQVENKTIEYTHKFIPNNTELLITWKQVFILIIKRKILLSLNIYMNNDKIVHIIGNIE